ncbi:hypothetical protein H0O02_00190 [Candidatus Micrarchaeota archaeon]|nr:hypothetical protein [Candidatus Micrarchaeota archaeon]
MAELDDKIAALDQEAEARADETLRRINVALKLNAPKLKGKKIPPNVKRLMEWKNALEYWKERYGGESNDVEFMAERLASFYEICTHLK